MPSIPSETMASTLWKRWLNGSGVTIKMFECPQWDSPAEFGECVEHMLTTYPASVMRFDLPAVNFIQSLPVGFVYKADEKLQWCASPGDIGTWGAGCGLSSEMTKEQYLEDYWSRRQDNPWPAYSPPLHVSWEIAFEYQHFLINNLAPKWTPVDQCYYRANQFCQFYNEVSLKGPSLNDVESIIVRSYAKDDATPEGPIQMAKELRAYIRDRYDLLLPIVQYMWLEEECHDPRATVKRWIEGKEAASNSIFFPVEDNFLEPQRYDEHRILSTPVGCCSPAALSPEQDPQRMPERS